MLGSVTKTYTATALMRLVAQGRVVLDAPVRRYVPELRLVDERAVAEISVLNLLNHTAGLDWRLIVDTGEGDDALAAYVATLDAVKQIAPPGARASYSQVGYNLAGRVIEKVTGLTYERATATLLLEPLAELRQSMSAERFQYGSLWFGLVVDLAAHVGGYLLRASAPTELIGLLGDLLYTLGWALWTGAVVVVLLQIFPEAKRRQVLQALDAYEAVLRDKARVARGQTSPADGAPSAGERPD